MPLVQYLWHLPDCVVIKRLCIDFWQQLLTQNARRTGIYFGKSQQQCIVAFLSYIIGSYYRLVRGLLAVSDQFLF